MSIEEKPTEESAIRLAEIMCDVMNMTPILHSELALHESDPIELRSALLQIADGMTWVASAVTHGRTAGITWPPDAKERIERLRAALDAWDPAHPPPPSALDAARSCLQILQPT
jgi:hypothetical protein